MKLVWVSDIHLNFLKSLNNRIPFYDEIKNCEPDIVVISGDIAESHNVVPMIEEMKHFIKVPVHFVLGNHDFYGSSVNAVCSSVKHLHHLAQTPLVKLSETTALVGVDAWTGDCRNGDYENSRLTMSDWIYIEDLNAGYRKGSAALKATLQKLADNDARLLARRVLKATQKGYKRVIIVTHVPPFANACLYAGRKSTPDGLCFWSSKILGETIEPIAAANPEVDFLWLCGHTHSKVKLTVLKNLIVQVAGAEYYYPTVAGVIEYE